MVARLANAARIALDFSDFAARSHALIRAGANVFLKENFYEA
jgi:hypothetical protein